MTQSTLTSQPTADVLASLFADAARSREVLQSRRNEQRIPDVPQHTPEYWAAFRDVHLAISPDTGRLLYLLARFGHARSIVEFGTSFGVSTIHLAAALRDNGGGLVIGTEFEATKAVSARNALASAGLADLVDIRDGDATETLRGNIPDPIDLVFLDGAKTIYLDVLKLLEDRLRPDAVVVADNAGRSPEYLAYVRDGGNYLSVPGLGDDVEVSVRLG